MSHYRVKTEYHEEGSYGSIVKKTLYAHHNNSCDYITFYDNDGTCLFSFPSTEAKNIFEAMKLLEAPHRDMHNLVDGVEYMTPEDQKKCGM